MLLGCAYFVVPAVRAIIARARAQIASSCRINFKMAIIAHNATKPYNNCMIAAMQDLPIRDRADFELLPDEGF